MALSTSGFVTGCPHGAVPQWSCGCGTDRNFGNRSHCRSCGREAPQSIRNKQRVAVAKAEKGKQQTPGSGSRASTDELRSLREKVATLERERAQQSPAEASAGGCSHQDELGKEVSDLEQELRACQHFCAPALVEARAKLEVQLRDARARWHASWPASRHVTKAERVLADRAARAEKAQLHLSDLQAQLAVLQEEVAAAEQRYQVAEQARVEADATLAQQKELASQGPQEPPPADAAPRAQLQALLEQFPSAVAKRRCLEDLASLVSETLQGEPGALVPAVQWVGSRPPGTHDAVAEMVRAGAALAANGASSTHAAEGQEQDDDGMVSVAEEEEDAAQREATLADDPDKWAKLCQFYKDREVRRKDREKERQARRLSKSAAKVVPRIQK